MAKWTKAADCKSGILGSNPSAASTFYNLSAGGGMADTRDLKSLPRKGVRVRLPPRAFLKHEGKEFW